MTLQEAQVLRKLDERAKKHRCTIKRDNLHIVGYVDAHFDDVTIPVCISKANQFGNFAAATVDGEIISEWDMVASEAFLRLAKRIKAKVVIKSEVLES